MSTHNSEFLLNLLLEENNHLVPIDFISKDSSFACVCISFAICQQYVTLKNSFPDDFAGKYLEIYASAMDTYRKIVGNSNRQVFFDEVNKFYNLNLSNHNVLKNLATDPVYQSTAHSLIEQAECAIILRDEIAFVIICCDVSKYIIIDPHAEYTGILSAAGVYRYITYDGIWDSDVHVITVG